MDSYEKIQFSNKYFMYSSPEWVHEHPVVDLIRIFKENTLIKYKYGKGNTPIKKYSRDYNHRLIGCDLNSITDYSNIFIKGKIECIFIFADSPNDFITNLKKFGTTNKIPLVELSTRDYYYHYSYEGESHIFKNPSELLQGISDSVSFNNKIKEFIPFDLFQSEEIVTETNLEKCITILNEREKEEMVNKEMRKIKHFDPHYKILVNHKREVNKQIMEKNNNKNSNSISIIIPKTAISKFFRKNT